MGLWVSQKVTEAFLFFQVFETFQQRMHLLIKLNSNSKQERKHSLTLLVRGLLGTLGFLFLIMKEMNKNDSLT